MPRIPYQLLRALTGAALVASLSAGAVRAQEAPGARLAPGEPIPAAELEAFVDGAVGDAQIAGVTVSVVQGGEVALAKGYGFADLEAARRVDPETTLFRIGSITKTFTWLMLLEHVAAGRIELDDPINDYLPSELRVPEQGFAEPIRLRHLMTHSPGFEDSVLGHLFVDDPAEIRSLGEYLRAERVERVRPAGELSSYSNYGVGLAGAVLERLERRPWQEALEARILEPLGLEHTSGREPYPARPELPAPMPDGLASDLSIAYRWTGTRYEARELAYLTQVAPAGVIASTAADMARYMLALLEGGTLDGRTVFGPATNAAIRTPLTTLPAAAGNWNAGFLELVQPGGFRSIGHSGGTLSFFSNLTVVPELDLGVFVSTNTVGGGMLTATLARRIIQHFYAPAPSAPPQGSAALAERGDTYAGAYLGTRRPYDGLEGFLFRFMALLSVSVTDDGFLIASPDGQVSRFVPADAPHTFRPLDAGIGLQFQVDGGRATRIASAVQGMDRVGALYRSETLLGVAALAFAVSLTIVVGFIGRPGLGTGTRGQLAASRIRLFAAACWLVSFVAALVLVAGALDDQARVVYDWPTPAALIFSGFALLASLVTAASVLSLPAAWRGGIYPASWTAWRRVRFTLSVLALAAASVVLGLWGALQPWNV